MFNGLFALLLLFFLCLSSSETLAGVFIEDEPSLATNGCIYARGRLRRLDALNLWS